MEDVDILVSRAYLSENIGLFGPNLTEGEEALIFCSCPCLLSAVIYGISRIYPLTINCRVIFTQFSRLMCWLEIFRYLRLG
jgi:hypothetical protein